MHDSQFTMHNHPLFRRATYPQVAGRSGPGLRCRRSEGCDRVAATGTCRAPMPCGRGIYHTFGMEPLIAKLMRLRAEGTALPSGGGTA